MSRAEYPWAILREICSRSSKFNSGNLLTAPLPIARRIRRILAACRYDGLNSRSDIDPNEAVGAKVETLLHRHSLTPIGQSRSKEGACSGCGRDLEPGWEWCPTCGASRYPGEFNQRGRAEGLQAEPPSVETAVRGAEKGSTGDDIERWNAIARSVWTSRSSAQRWVGQHVLLPAIDSLLSEGSSKLLDVGCGDASLSASLAARRGMNLWAFDASKEMRRLAAANIEEGRILSSLAEIDNASISSAMANMVLSAIQNPESLLREVHRVLEPSGELIVTLPHPCFTLIRDMHRTTVRKWSSEPTPPHLTMIPNGLQRYLEEPVEEVVWDIQKLNLSTPLYNRTLAGYFGLFENAGFTVQDLTEPVPADG